MEETIELNRLIALVANLFIIFKGRTIIYPLDKYAMMFRNANLSLKVLRVLRAGWCSIAFTYTCIRGRMFGHSNHIIS